MARRVPGTDPSDIVPTSATPIALRFAIATRERSMPPLAIATVMASARRPISGSANPMDWMFRGERNCPGRRARNSAPTRMTSPRSRRVSGWVLGSLRRVGLSRVLISGSSLEDR